MIALDRTKAPSIKQIAHFSIEKPNRQTLPNGMTLNVINSGTEDVVRFDLVIHSGQLEQTQPLQAMFANRMLREGTLKYNSTDIAEKLDYYGAWLDLSSSVNCGFITLYSLGKYFPQTMEILASMVKEPVYPEREMKIVIDMNKHHFMVNNQRVDVLARKRLNQLLFGKDHPLGHFAALEDYDQISVESLKHYYTDNYSSNNCTAYISGKVSDQVLKCIETHFGSEAWGSQTARKETIMMAPNTADVKRVFIEKEDALQSSIKMGCFVPEREHKDYLDLRVLTTLFGGYFGSRLMSNIREDKGYTYGIVAGVLSYPGCSIMGISTEADNQYVEPLISEVYNEMDKLCTDKVPEEELEMVRNYMLGDMCRAYERAFSLSDAWIFIETSNLDEDFFDRSVQSIRGINAERIQELAQKYFIKEKLIEVVAGKKNK